MQQNNIVSNIEMIQKQRLIQSWWIDTQTRIYIFLFVTTDDDNNQVELSDEEKATAKATLKGFRRY